jgi:hypothetical protein
MKSIIKSCPKLEGGSYSGPASWRK